MHTPTDRHYYARGNTARGAYSLLSSSLEGMEQIYVLEGGSERAQTQLIQEAGSRFHAAGHEVWYLHNPSVHNGLDGIAVPERLIAVIAVPLPSYLDSADQPHTIHRISLESAFRSNPNAAEIDQLRTRIVGDHVEAYTRFAEALRVHDEWEAIYIRNMDFDAANTLTEELTAALYGEQQQHAERKGRELHRFLGAATPNGAVDFVPNLTDGSHKRYFIKGRAGSGKSTLLKKLAAAGAERGYDVEIYHCGFDPNSLDMVLVRELGFAIFDSTAPHEYFPELASDEVVDMYERCIQPGTDEAHEQELTVIKGRYAAAMKEAIQHLAHAQSLHADIEAYCEQAADGAHLEQMKEEFLTVLLTSVSDRA